MESSREDSEPRIKCHDASGKIESERERERERERNVTIVDGFPKGHVEFLAGIYDGLTVGCRSSGNRGVFGFGLAWTRTRIRACACARALVRMDSDGKWIGEKFIDYTMQNDPKDKAESEDEQ